MYAHDTSPLLDKSIHYPLSGSSSSAMMSSPYRSINSDGDDSTSAYHQHVPHRTPSTRQQHDNDDLFATPSSSLSPSSSSASLTLSQSSSYTNSKDDDGHSSSSSHGGGTASIPALTFTLSNTILGAGVLGIAHAYSNSGYVLGLVLLLLSAALSLFGLHLLTLSARTLNTNPASFYTVAHGIAPAATPLIDAALVVKCFGVATSYLIVIGDLLPTALAALFPDHLPSTPSSSTLWMLADDRRAWITLFMLGLAMPLSCLRSLNALRFTATLSIAFVSILSLTIIVHSLFPSTFPPCDDASDPTSCKGSTVSYSFSLSTLSTLPVFIFAFTCAQNVFTVYNELKDHTQVRTTTTLGSAILLALFFYTLISTFAYHTYGDLVTSNILTAYPASVPLAVVRIIIAVNVAFTFPLQVNPCRNSLYLLVLQLKARFGGGAGGGSGQGGEGGAGGRGGGGKKKAGGSVVGLEKQQMGTGWLIGLSVGICGLSWLVAFFVQDLGVVLALVGATGSTLISYILPGWFYSTLHRERTWTRMLAMGLMAWGIIVIPVCLTLIFMGAKVH